VVESGAQQNTADLDSLVEKIHQMSQYLGDEIVVVGVQKSDKPGFAIVSECREGGLDDFLRREIPVLRLQNAGITVLDRRLISSVFAVDIGKGTIRRLRSDPARNMRSFQTALQHLKVIECSAELRETADSPSGDFGKQIAVRIWPWARESSWPQISIR
jgi:hypothetical protein